MHNKNSDRTEFTARYFIESSVPIEKAAETIAGEQSRGTFMFLPGETDELKGRSRARVTRIDTPPPVLELASPTYRLMRVRSSMNNGFV